jgi:tripartite-type tricarboxylate transporter receptor subunit TctC
MSTSLRAKRSNPVPVALDCFVALLLAMTISGAAMAQSYPSRTVTVIVPFPPGGSVDGVGRIIVDRLNQAMGPHFIVENRAGGASGNVGANLVAKADPDGYTLLETASLHVVSPFLYKDVPFDVVKDFTPITLIAKGPLIVSTAPNVPANNLKDFFDLVRKDPKKYTFGNTSLGSASHLVIELLKREANVDTLVVSYKGTGPALTDLMSGQIQLVADPMLSSLPLAQSGRIKALAITSLKRQPAAPDIPTVEESGLPGFEFVSWYGLWGPKNLPAEITAKLQANVAAILAEPDVKARLAALGFEGIGSTSDDFAKYIASEMTRYGQIIHDANIKAE